MELTKDAACPKLRPPAGLPAYLLNPHPAAAPTMQTVYQKHILWYAGSELKSPGTTTNSDIKKTPPAIKIPHMSILHTVLNRDTHLQTKYHDDLQMSR